MRAFIDTNVLVYLFDSDSPDKKATAQTLLAEPKHDLVFSTQVLQEFYVTVTRKLSKPLAAATAERAVRDFACFTVIPNDTDLILAGIARSSDGEFSFWDAMIVEAALRSGANCLFSEDMQDGREIDHLTIRNPFSQTIA